MGLVNMRKEFFHVSLAELECFATDRDLKISFTKVAEAREYRESTEMRRARRPAEMAPRSSHFPSTLAPVEVVAAL